MVVRVHKLLLRQRSHMINALRGHAAAFGVVAAKGAWTAEALMRHVMSSQAGQQDGVGLAAEMAGTPTDKRPSAA
ncbi:MAG: hypothetical protein IT555_03525 [Acetobacteraceae bacterium]|nr:hypothetical protein [Acetobacteraceae bacterium]